MNAGLPPSAGGQVSAATRKIRGDVTVVRDAARFCRLLRGPLPERLRLVGLETQYAAKGKSLICNSGSLRIILGSWGPTGQLGKKAGPE
jgi:hypothetical protein